MSRALYRLSYTAVEVRGVEPRPPVCDTGALPLRHTPVRGRTVRPSPTVRWWRCGELNPDRLPARQVRYRYATPPRDAPRRGAWWRRGESNPDRLRAKQVRYHYATSPGAAVDGTVAGCGPGHGAGDRT